MSQENNTGDIIALMWDCHGLESAINISNISKKRTWAALRGDVDNLPTLPNLMHWQLRAQCNSHRNYEIYTITVTDGITVDDIVQAFNENPQHMAETVRRMGHKFYSNRRDNSQIRIT